MTPISLSLKIAVATLGLLLLQTSLFAWAVKPIKGVGIVVKKNPGSSAEKIATTDEAGNFQLKLTRGSYQLSLPEQQILSAIKAVNETGKTIASNGQELDAVTCAIMETEGIKIWKSEAVDGNVSAIIEVTAAEATIAGTLTYDVKTNKGARSVGHPKIIITMTDGMAKSLEASPAVANENMGATDHAINEQGLPGSGSGPKKGGSVKKPIKIKFGEEERISQPNGQNDSDPFPLKQNAVEKRKGASYVGHQSLNKREINPESGSQPNMETFTPTNKLPGKNQKIIFYEIKTISIPGYSNTQPGNMAVAYHFYTANGKTYAVPSLLFDLPTPPSDIQFPVADFSSSASRMAKPTSSGSEISFNPSTQQCDLSYQTMVGGKTAMVQMSLTEIETTMSNNPTQSSYWCGVGTNCGAVFAVLVTNGTPCGNVNSFFNKVCDGLKSTE